MDNFDLDLRLSLAEKEAEIIKIKIQIAQSDRISTEENSSAESLPVPVAPQPVPVESPPPQPPQSTEEPNMPTNQGKAKRVWNPSHDEMLCGCRRNTCDHAAYYGQCQKIALQKGGYCKNHIKEYNSKGWFRLGDVRTFGVGTFNSTKYFKSDKDAIWLPNVCHKMMADRVSDVDVEYTDGRPAEIIAKFPIRF